MFNFARWRAWLENKVAGFRVDGLDATLRWNDDGPKPGLGFGLIGRHAIGLLENWHTGETDYTIHAPHGGEMVAHAWMRVLTDETFEATFNEFVAEFRKHDQPPPISN
jgi:hypothetical protein